MRRRVIAHGGGARFGIYDRRYNIANLKMLSCANLVKANSLHGHETSQHICEDGIPLGVVQPTHISDLTARIRVERCVVEDNFSFFIWLQLTRRHGASSKNTSDDATRSEEHTSELQSLRHLVCRLLLEKK